MAFRDIFKKKEEEDFTQRPPPIDAGPMPGVGLSMPPANGSIRGPSVSLPPPPMPPSTGAKPRLGEEKGLTLLTEDLEEISEAIIQEKWTKFMNEWDKMQVWKDDVDDSLSELSATLNAIEKKIDSIEKAVLGKVEDYSKSISDVRTELKAMQKVFGDVMPVFTENVKKLEEITDKEEE